MKNTFARSACALAACAALGPTLTPAQAQDATQADTAPTQTIEVVGKRQNRISKGATGLPLAIKDTPQSISTLDREDLENYGVTGSNDALRLATGINVEQYETNRATFNSRGFDVQLTQIDGLGMSNSWGTVVGQQDTFLFDRIELIRGANGLLTGVGNASGTINYVRKRPTNKDFGEIAVAGGSYDAVRATADVNKVLTEDGAWAGRVVVAHDDKGSHLRALHDERTSLYAVADGQIGDNGVLTIGLTHLNHKQQSPMWGSLTLWYTDGTQADFDASASTSQDWTRWDTKSDSAFIEYSHALGADWEAKLTYSHTRAEEETRLLYAYSATGAGLNPDGTGLSAWPYASYTTTENNLVDANLTGSFRAFGRKHTVIAGLSHSKQKTVTDVFRLPLDYSWPGLPSFPYDGDVYPEPVWGPREAESTGEQTLTRFYAAAHLRLTDALKIVGGLNAIELRRLGSSRYGTSGDLGDSTLSEVSPYVGVTYDVTPEVLAYASYSDIFLNQEQRDFDGRVLDPVQGVNVEAGVKAEWLNQQLLTTLSVFSAEALGQAEEAGQHTDPDHPRSGQYYYVAKDVKSKGVELEVVGKLGRHDKVAMGFTRLDISTPDGVDNPWIPRTVVNVRYDAAFSALPALKAGVAARWQSDVTTRNGLVKQDAFLLAHGYVAYDVTDRSTVRLNVNNLLDKKYIGGLAYDGAIYGAPRNATVSVNYKF
ncbi:TonB-dependent siderophore receptor [Ideonella sp.]|uniref:TonB-dependent siderophore receptor n=1 Tax=Ideonella sp. TaxID=1929293 RepID=UPI0035B2401A